MTIGARLASVVVLAWMVAYPAKALAQASITGSVTDPSGAPMSGVTVEASSPALIEKSRTTVTDGGGRYRIEDLRPGIYHVRFTLEGWSPYQQEGVELTGSITAPVDAVLAIGALTEAVSVTGEVPAVDVHTAKRETTLSGDLVRSIPTVRSYNALLPLVPGVVTNFNDTVTGTATTSFPLHAGRANEGRLWLDGLTIGSPPSGNSATSYVVDVGQAQEVTFTTAGTLGETETAGLVMNIVPKSGGNVMKGSLFASGTGGRLQSNNVTEGLERQGVAASAPQTRVYDVSGTLGGPILRDRVWYFVNAHRGGSRTASTNVYYNLNAGDVARWLYSPDSGRPAYSDRAFESVGGRLTWLATPRNTVGGFWDAQALCRNCTGATAGLQEPARVSPEAVGVLGRPLHVSQATWSSPATSRLLLEAGYGGTFFGVGNFEREPNPTRDLIRVAEQCANGCAANGNIPGLVYRSQDFSVAYTGSYLWKGSVSYITSTHSLKFGYQHTLMTDDRTWITNNQNLTYRFDNGSPNQLTQSISPWVNNARVGWDGLFVQEQWTRHRLTLQGAVRFDRARSWFPAQQEGPSRFLPTPIIVPETRGVDSYKDVTPRMGAAYDLFGNGRTALKMTLGRYLEGAGVIGNYANTNPTLRMPQTTSVFGTAGVTRSWTDADHDFVPDCDLLNPAAQDLRPEGGDHCGLTSNTLFGQNVLTNNFDPRVLDGWGVRPSDWNLTVSVQQEIAPRSSIDVTYTRRWYRGFFVADNLALEPADLTPFSIMAPPDPRLPGGGGYMVSGLYDVVPEKAGQVDNFITDAGTYGAWRHHFDGIDVTANVRVGRDLLFAGGTSTGQTVSDNCDVRAHLPELATTTTGTSAFGAGLASSAVTPVSPYCRVASGVLTQFRGLSTYLVPKVAIQLAATFQSKPGATLAANYAAPNSEVAPSLGRDLSGDAPNVTVNLVAPGTMYGDRLNQLDVRAARTLTFGRTRTMIALDVYNVTNSSAVLTYNNAFISGGTWLQPLTILSPRLFRITAEIVF
ncbi:MAG TPA: carboxypeptidase regulatory-like domain-containing protein [Gemmatimonadales bacterium]|nr:carboxypeptidase regulatory-like domain-containing protein [Gemmatimonadales bacterium]